MQHTSQSSFSRLITAASLACLLLALLVGIGPNWSSRLMGIGGSFWDGYAKDLRVDPTAPDCVLADLDKELGTCPAEAEAPKEPTDIGDPFADEEPTPAADIGDPFADEEPTPAADIGDPFADDEDAPATTEGDPFADDADPFADDGPAPKNCAALRNLRDTCEQRHAEFIDLQSRITTPVRMYRTIEGAIATVGSFPYSRHLLLLFLALSAISTTLSRLHISIRTPESRQEVRSSEGAMALAHLLLTATAIANIIIEGQSETEIEHPLLPYLMAVGFGTMAVINILNWVRTDTPAADAQSPIRLLMVIPLHAYMAILAGAYFLLAEFHPSGQAIYVHKFAQHPNIYLGIGLYIWSGMLLANTRIAKLLFQIITPWNLPPALLAWLVVVVAAYPTAYSGASGIFVMAAGAVIFTQMRSAGASSRLALTTTAMSGSLGVVLNPCLVIVLIAILNKNVTTAELFGMGRWVFILTALLFLFAMVAYWGATGFKIHRPARTLSIPERIQMSGKAFLALLPYVGATALVLLAFWGFTDTLPNERTAPFVLPVILMALVAYDRWSEPDDIQDSKPFVGRLIAATGETAHHSGALLMVMVCSVGIGGLIERSGLMEMFPSEFGSPIAAMAILVVVMVIVGMTMDALGAVVLVSFSVATLAETNGINAVHFWMMVLVAFELGYLTPPVAINHLLARQVIGDAARVEHDGTTGFLKRYQHVVLPMIVMATALILVAFVPFAWYP